MHGTEYECKDCSRAFRVREEGKRLKCPGCKSENVAPKEKKPLPGWLCKAQAAKSN